jgi:hypothetical protein
MNRIQVFSLLLASSAVLAGCVEHSAPLQHQIQTVEKDSATSLRTSIHMGAGTLNITGGTAAWLTGDFASNVPDWKPVIHYAAGDLKVEQPESKGIHTGNSKNEWRINLNNGVPQDLEISLGAGQAELALGDLQLRSLDLTMGAGSLRLDLLGNPKTSYKARVNGGAGEATILVPKNAGICATIAGGFGAVSVKGLKNDGSSRWTNDGCGSAPVQVSLDIQAGVGALSLIAE